MDKHSKEFTDYVLYGLLPYSKTKVALRISTFPSFLDIKKFFREYNYTEQEWNLISNKIFDLVYG